VGNAHHRINDCKAGTWAEPHPTREEEPRPVFLAPSRLRASSQAKIAGVAGSDEPDRLWQQQARRRKPGKMLADIYGWFTEALIRKICRRLECC